MVFHLYETSFRHRSWLNLKSDFADPFCEKGADLLNEVYR